LASVLPNRIIPPRGVLQLSQHQAWREEKINYPSCCQSKVLFFNSPLPPVVFCFEYKNLMQPKVVDVVRQLTTFFFRSCSLGFFFFSTGLDCPKFFCSEATVCPCSHLVAPPPPPWNCLFFFFPAVISSPLLSFVVPAGVWRFFFSVLFLPCLATSRAARSRGS